MIETRPATIGDFALFHPSEPNIAEIRAVTDAEILRCMALLWETSGEKTAVIQDGRLIALYGIAEDNELWLFFSGGLQSLPLSFFKKSRQFIAEHPKVHGRVYIKNKFAIDWARFLGFSLSQPYKFGQKGEMFMDFFKKEAV